MWMIRGRHPVCRFSTLLRQHDAALDLRAGGQFVCENFTTPYQAKWITWYCCACQIVSYQQTVGCQEKWSHSEYTHTAALYYLNCKIIYDWFPYTSHCWIYGGGSSSFMFEGKPVFVTLGISLCVRLKCSTSLPKCHIQSLPPPPLPPPTHRVGGMTIGEDSLQWFYSAM